MTDQSMDERVSALEEKLDEQNKVLLATAMMVLGAIDNAKEQAEKDDRSFEEVGKILENHKDSIEALAKMSTLRQEGTDNRLQELTDALTGIEEQIDFLCMSLDETDDVAESNVDETADAIETLRANVNLMANGLAAYIKHHTDLHESMAGVIGDMGEAVDQLSTDFYDPEDVDDGSGALAADDDGVVFVSGAADFDGLMDDLPVEEPDATIMRLSPSEFDEEFDADSVPPEAIETMLEIQADAVGVMSLEFDGDLEDREEALLSIYQMLDEAAQGGGYDEVLIEDFRTLITKGGMEFLTQATHMAPPGFISSSLGMMAEAEIDDDEPGVYLVALSDTRDLIEVCAALYLINCAKNNIQP